jgi:hypothetical protein
MTFNAASYFAGVGTVLATLTLGFGGGMLMSGVFADKAPREPNKVERQMADRAKPEAPPVSTSTPVIPAIPKNEAVAATAPPSSQPQKEPEPAAALPVPQAQPQPQVTTQVIPQPAPALGRDRPVALVHPAMREHDGKQDLKRKAAEKRKAEREKRRAERRREHETREAQRQQQREAQQASAAQRSRQAEAEDDEREERPFFGAREREDFPRPRLFRFFGSDD